MSGWRRRALPRGRGRGGTGGEPRLRPAFQRRNPCFHVQQGGRVRRSRRLFKQRDRAFSPGRRRFGPAWRGERKPFRQRIEAPRGNGNERGHAEQYSQQNQHRHVQRPPFGLAHELELPLGVAGQSSAELNELVAQNAGVVLQGGFGLIANEVEGLKRRGLLFLQLAQGLFECGSDGRGLLGAGGGGRIG